MSSPNDITLAEMLSSRFAHDMAGPIAAVNNGLEYLLMDAGNGVDDAAADLLKLSAAEGMAKLQLFRLAFGRTDAHAENDTEEFQAILQRFFAQSKVTLEWDNASIGPRMNNEVRRVLANMVIAASSLLIYGGTLKVQKSDDPGGKRMMVVGEHERIKEDDDIDNILSHDKPVELTPANVPVYYLSQIAKKHNMKVAFSRESTRIVLALIYS